jgi:hypothetical protein
MARCSLMREVKIETGAALCDRGCFVVGEQHERKLVVFEAKKRRGRRKYNRIQQGALVLDTTAP